MSARALAPVLVALALSVLALPVRAQTAGEASARPDTMVVLPGDARLDLERLVPHRVTWRVTIEHEDGGSTVQGLWTDVWVRSEEEGRPVVHFRQLFVDTTGTILVDNQTVFRASDFGGLRSTQHLPPGGTRVSYRFEGDTVSGTLRPSADQEPRRFEVVFEEPVWEEPLIPLINLLPFEALELGTVIRYPVWNQTGPGGDVTWRTFRVDSVGSVQAADGSTRKAWHHTLTMDGAPNTVFRNLRTPGPPYVWWLRVERPARTREWTLVDWRLLGR